VRVLVACEFSGIVRDAFIKEGHVAESCDLLPTERPNWTLDRFSQIRTHHPDRGHHHQCDIEELLSYGMEYDLMIAFPPCTHLASSGARWFKEKIADGRQQRATDFFMGLVNADIPKIAIENPIGIMSTKYRKPDQIIQPWQFGHGETKATCLWLKNLPKLVPTDVVEGREPRIWKMAPAKDRAKKRSITYQGIANAMAKQWGGDSS
jgi:hypothetical protein